MTKAYQVITKQIGFSYAIMAGLFLLNPILIFILTRMLSVKEYGIYALLAVTINMAGVLLDFGLSQYIITKLAGLPGKEQQHTFSFLFQALTAGILTLMIILLLTPARGVLISWLRVTSYLSPFLIMLAIIVCSALTRLCTAYFTAQKRLILVQITFFISQGAWIILVALLFLCSYPLTITSVMLCWLSGALATIGMCVLLLRKDIFFAQSKEGTRIRRGDVLKESVIFSTPLLLFIGAAWIVEAGDRYIINALIGPEAVGHYALIYSLIGIIATTSAVIFTGLYPYLATAWNTKRKYNHYLNAMVKYTLMISVPAMIGFFILRKEIISLVSGTAYLGAAAVVPALILYPLFNALSQILYQVEMLRRKTLYVGLLYAAGALLNIALNLMLIPWWGIVGAGVSTTITYVLIFAMLLIDTRGIIVIHAKFLRLGRIALAGIGMGILISLVHPSVFWTKLATIALGATGYVALIIILRVLSKEEQDILRNTARGMARSWRKAVEKMADRDGR